MRETAGYTWTDCKPEIAKGLNITQFLDKIQQYIRKYLQHVNRIHFNRHKEDNE
jgi:hypothetical protein